MIQQKVELRHKLFLIMKNLSSYRKVFNIETIEWELIEEESNNQQGNIYWFNLSYDDHKGEGSYLYKMEPNTSSKAHEHTGPEEFFILEGDLTDPDGYTYNKGDFVQLSSGSSHKSITKTGCTAVVTHRGKFIYSE
jgi:quercetin dioxygenase-like cupin family protein